MPPAARCPLRLAASRRICWLRVGDIRLAPVPDGSDVKDGTMGAFRRNAALDADRLSVETTSCGTVILAGTVSSWAEHDQAVAAAWSAPGVTEVDDRIVIEY
jgi:osmotically-inducible protein OsmY